MNNFNLQEDNDLKKAIELLSRNYKLFIICLIIVFALTFLINQYSTPIYKISAAVMVKENERSSSQEMKDYINSNLFGKNQNFQNELWMIQSLPVIENTVKGLDLAVTYYRKKSLMEIDAYQEVPFKILYSATHVQPLNVRFNIVFNKNGKYSLEAESDEVDFYRYSSHEYVSKVKNWNFQRNGTIGKLLQTPDLAFIVNIDSTKLISKEDAAQYSFEFVDENSLARNFRNKFDFKVPDKKATVIEISFRSASLKKGIDVVNGLMDVYKKQGLDQKNHLANITIEYIDQQLGEISDSLSMTEQNLQQFRSANQILNVADQSSGISAQYIVLQNQLAELVTKKRYYDYVSNYITNNDDYSNISFPSSLGIPDQILTNLMTELISAQAQRSNLIENKQERNPLVGRLNIKIENLKKTIADNISAVRQTTEISIDEMRKRVSHIESQISRLPQTEQRLGGFERKYKLNDAIYNYLLEKRAEAKITKASNLPDAVILEPARRDGNGPVSPNPLTNFIIAFVLGIGMPFGFLVFRKALNDKIESQESIERITDVAVLGKIIHNHKKTGNVVFEFPKSPIAESYRVLRTNLDYTLGGGNHKVIMVTSCITGEGKSFNALNIAMSYAQLGRKTILIDFDLRKPTSYFERPIEEPSIGVSSYLINKVSLKDIILNSPDGKLDYINSGPIPPNPAEILALEETKRMITSLKDQYDYIIIDTPPLAQVTDGFLLMESADIKVVVVRYNFSKKKVVSMVLKDLKHKGIDNVCIILNDNRIKSDQYGYGYGYNKKGK